MNKRGNTTLSWPQLRTHGWFWEQWWTLATPQVRAAPASHTVGNLLYPPISDKLVVTEHWRVKEGKPGQQLLSENIWLHRMLSELSFLSKTHNCINQKHNSTMQFPHYSNLKQQRPWQALVSHPTDKKITNVTRNHTTEDHLGRSDDFEWEARSYHWIFTHFYNVRTQTHTQKLIQANKRIRFLNLIFKLLVLFYY